MINKLLGILPVVGFIFMMFALEGCAGRTHTEVVRPALTIPPQMFQCEEASPRPKGEVIMESEVARYIASLEYTNKDCKTQLKELQILIKCSNDSKCDVNKLIEYIGLIPIERKN